jgi:hypothetical protein
MSRRGLVVPWAVVLTAALFAVPLAGGAAADAPSALTSAEVLVQVGLRNSDDVGLRVDLRAEVYVDDALVTEGTAASLVTGSSGFNNSRRHRVSFPSFAPYPLTGPSVFTVRLLARNACTGSGKNSGSIRLWLNDFSALSAAELVMDGVDGHVAFFASDWTFFPVGPRRWVDLAVGPKCGAWRPVGSWSGHV